MHGNVVKVIKEVGFYCAHCPSLDDAICVTFDYGGNTNLVDLPTGKLIITSQNLLNIWIVPQIPTRLPPSHPVL
jgi:hypothetical protein